MPEQESSQEHEFHPSVEKIMETSGPNIGKIKDPEVARWVADKDAAAKERDGEYYRGDESRDFYNERAVALDAVQNTELVEDVAGRVGKSDSSLRKSYDEALAEAGDATESYRKFQMEARPAHVAEENKHLKEQLAKEREKNQGSGKDLVGPEVSPEPVAMQTAEQFEADHPEAKEAIEEAKPEIDEMVSQAILGYEQRSPSDRQPSGFFSAWSSRLEFPSSDPKKEDVFAYAHALLGVPQSSEPTEQSLYTDTTTSSNGVFEIEVKRATGNYDPQLGAPVGGDYDSMRIHKIGEHSAPSPTPQSE